MRLWSLHPKYLDRQGLTALWRETLLAQAVLRGQTRGYRRHPQLERFRAVDAPLSAINRYLAEIHTEAGDRGYTFDVSKIGPIRARPVIHVTAGQLEYEWRHLRAKLQKRSPALYKQWRAIELPEAHPIFVVRPGPVEPWERTG